MRSLHWRRHAPGGLSRLEQPRRFHGLVYINALTLSTVLFVLAAQLLLGLPGSTKPSIAAATVQPTTTTAIDNGSANAQSEISAEPTANQLSISATVRPTPRRALPDCSSPPYRPPAQLPGQGLSGGVHLTQDTSTTYPVYGDTIAAIESDIARCTPITTSEGRFAATTGYALATYYRYADSGGSCRVSSAVVTLHLNQTFPQWQGSASASSQTRTTWNNFIINLHTHEQGHIDLGRTAAQNLYDQLQSMEAPSCSALQTLISATTNSIVSNLRIANNHYDDITKHGTTQGAVL